MAQEIAQMQNLRRTAGISFKNSHYFPVLEDNIILAVPCKANFLAVFPHLLTQWTTNSVLKHTNVGTNSAPTKAVLSPPLFPAQICASL